MESLHEADPEPDQEETPVLGMLHEPTVNLAESTDNCQQQIMDGTVPKKIAAATFRVNAPTNWSPYEGDEDIGHRNGLIQDYRNPDPFFNRKQPPHHQEYYSHRNGVDQERQTPIPLQGEYLRHLAEAIAGAINSATSNRQSQSPKGFRRPERYDGRQHWNDYLTHFEMCAELSGWNDREKATQLAASLDGQALQVLSNLRREERLKVNHQVKAVQSR